MIVLGYTKVLGVSRVSCLLTLMTGSGYKTIGGSLNLKPVIRPSPVMWQQRITRMQ